MTCTHPALLLCEHYERCACCPVIFPHPDNTADRRPCGCGADPHVFGHTHAT